jgi:CubicO group peptidase (beta-lactamase class C family)
MSSRLSPHYFILFLLLVTSCGDISKSYVASLPDSRFTELASFVEADLKVQNGIGVAFAVLENGKVRHAAAYGFANTQSKEKLTSHTVLNTESFTKSVVAAGAMALVDQRKIDLSAPITRYARYIKLKDPYDPTKITVENLLNHTSGYPGIASAYNHRPLPFDNSQPSGLSECFKHFTQEPLLVQPGSVWNYSNFGFALAGLVVESAASQYMHEFLAKNVLTPAGMKTATFSRSVANSRAHGVQYSASSSGGKDAEDLTSQPESFCDQPYDGLFASVEDVGAFGEMLLQKGGKVLTKEAARSMTSPSQSMGIHGLYYGYGMFIDIGSFTGDQDKDDIIVRAAGDGNNSVSGAHGTKTRLLLDPRTGFGFAVITNDGTYGLQKIIDKAFELYLGKKQTLPSNRQTHPSTWSVFAGTYNDPNTFGQMIVTLEGDHLFLKLPKFSYRTELTQYSDNAFAFVPPDALKEFGEQLVGTFWQTSSDEPARFFALRAAVGTRTAEKKFE